jgi:hypothetical protein
MLFHIKQTHAPKDCPYGKGGSRSLFDGASKDVKIHGSCEITPVSDQPAPLRGR